MLTAGGGRQESGIGRAAGWKNKTRTTANRRPGYHYLHNAVNDHSRLAYTEILTDETKETAAAFWQRANTWFQSQGITVVAADTQHSNFLNRCRR